MMPMVGDSREGSSPVDRPPPSVEISVAALENEMNNLPWAITGSKKWRPSIWRVYTELRKQDDEAYDPKMVSIGPLHHGKEEFLPMEEVKLESLRRLLKRPRGDKLAIYLKKIHGCLKEARKAYSEKVQLSDEKFAEMLVVDGCFLVEFLIHRASLAIYAKTFIAQLRGGLTYLGRDLMLLENQIPFFVLNILFKEIEILYPSLREGGHSENLVSLALRWLEIKLPPKKHPRAEDVRHLLHLKHLSMNPGLVEDLPYRQSYGQLVAIQGKKLMSLISVPFLGLFYLILFRDLSGLFGVAEQPRTSSMIPVAKELGEAGIAFKRKATSQIHEKACQLKVAFKDGTIQIPFFRVVDLTRYELRNAVAFEQCCRDLSSHFTSYCVFLDNIINTPDDVAILRKSGILENMLGSDAELADMFNGLCKEVFFDAETHYNAQLFKDVAAFCEVPHHRWRANLAQNYFNSPWTVISLIAGFLLLLFAGMQTFSERK